MPEIIGATCPYCGEPVELLVDESAGSCSYVEDCQVCCRPMQVDVEVDGGHVSARVRTNDE
jgi:hypothetical protein